MKKSELRDALCRWLAGRPGRHVALTLTFKPLSSGAGVPISVASDTLRHYLKRLNQRALGREPTRFGRRLEVIAVLEGGNGAADKHPHLHLLVGVPDRSDLREFERQCIEVWTGLRCASRSQNRCVECFDADGWLSYITKVDDKPDFMGAMLVEHWHLN